MKNVDGSAEQCYKMSERLIIVEAENERLKNTIQESVTFLFHWGEIDGGHHKQWTLDQVARILLDKKYDSFIKEFNSDEDYTPWDEGIAP